MRQSKKVVETAERILKDYDTPGAMVAISQDGELVYEHGFGYRNREESLPVTKDTVFGLASITKTFTSVAVMHLQESGKLDVHDPVVNYIPEFHVKDEEMCKKITIHHFLTHSSGLPPMSSLEYTMKVPDEDNPSGYRHFGNDPNQELLDTYEAMLTYIKNDEVELIAPPGTYFSYSNEAYGLLGLLIERVSGRSYAEYVHDHILKPCQMEHTQFTIAGYGAYDNITRSYGKQMSDPNEKIGPDEYWIDSVPMRSTGFIKSTAADMMRYGEVFRNGGRVGDTQIISSESVERMMTPHVRVQLGRYYGYGLSIVPDYYGHKLVEHGGSLRSISSQFSIIPEKGVSSLFVANIMGAPVATMLQKFLNTYFGRDMDASSVEYEKYDVDFSVVKQYTGEYRSDEGAAIELRIEDDELIFVRDDERFPTMFVRENIFLVYFKDAESLIEVLFNKKNEPYAISYNTRIVRKVNGSS